MHLSCDLDTVRRSLSLKSEIHVIRPEMHLSCDLDTVRRSLSLMVIDLSTFWVSRAKHLCILCANWGRTREQQTIASVLTNWHHVWMLLGLFYWCCKGLKGRTSLDPLSKLREDMRTKGWWNTNSQSVRQRLGHKGSTRARKQGCWPLLHKWAHSSWQRTSSDTLAI